MILEKIPEIIYLLDTSKKIAFDKIYREDILVFSASKEILSNKDLIAPLQKFVKLTLSLCGSEVTNDLINIYGDMESITSILGNDFINMVSERESFRNIEQIQMGLNTMSDTLVNKK